MRTSEQVASGSRSVLPGGCWVSQSLTQPTVLRCEREGNFSFLVEVKKGQAAGKLHKQLTLSAYVTVFGYAICFPLSDDGHFSFSFSLCCSRIRS
jgi:hypothetical protein